MWGRSVSPNSTGASVVTVGNDQRNALFDFGLTYDSVHRVRRLPSLRLVRIRPHQRSGRYNSLGGGRWIRSYGLAANRYCRSDEAQTDSEAKTLQPIWIRR